MRIQIKYLLLYCIPFVVACHSQEKVFEVLSPSQTGIQFINKSDESPDLNILSYIYYYNGGGVAIGDINNDGLPDIFFTANSKGNNKLYLNKGNFRFQDMTSNAGVAGASGWCTGVTMADVNGDGYLDIYVCAVANMHGLKGHNELFINNGNSTFTESSAAYGLNFSGYSTQAAFFDYDHDGDLDCFLLNQSEHPNQNIGDTGNRRKFDVNAGERLFRNELNNGSKKFTDVSSAAGLYQSSLCYGLGVSIGDMNNDGWDDIYVGNDFHENDYYYINNGNGTFTESGAKHFRHYSRYSMGNDIADFNNDGQLDVVTADMLPGDEKILKTYGNGEHLETYLQKITANGYQDQYSRNCLQRNNGNGESFSDVGLISGVSATDWSWSPLLADFDNDGNKDLFMSSGIAKRPLDLDFINFFSNIKDPRLYGSPDELKKLLLDKMPDGSSHPFFFKDSNGLRFKDVSDAWGMGDLKGCFNGAAYADLDNDGRLDLVTNCLNSGAVVLKNNSSKKNFISLSFNGNGFNKNGIGVKAYLFAGGKMQYQQLMLTRGFMSSTEPVLHFGLDSVSTIDSLLIVWPNQNYQLLTRVSVNRQMILKESDAKQPFDYDHFFLKQQELLQSISSTQNGLLWKHQEDHFIDFNTQYLIPHMESTKGPKMAISDVNKDGLDDVFLCAAKGQPDCLLIQNKDGKFIKTDTALFARNAAGETVDAAFFDANNDGFPDLYTVSGGNEYEDGDKNLADHFYINDRTGHYTEQANALPQILANKSCVSIADVNHDGNEDIFIGGFSSAKKYGYAQPSYLLLNDGKGHFTKAPSSIISLQQAGMITSSAFIDINNDGWKDLVIAGEWMPVKVFVNHSGNFKEENIVHSNGFWQTLYPADINGDGYIDMLAGNWGQNSKLHAGNENPLLLYLKDFDNNGSVEQIMAYTVNGNEYPFLGKDQLEIALPRLKKEHLSYDEVAGQPVQYLFGDLLAGSDKLHVDNLASACFINNGKGGFTYQQLPDELQLSPLFSFSSFIKNNQTYYMAAGNFYGVQPYEGRYDAMNPTLFTYSNQAKQFVYAGQLSSITKETRDMKWIFTSNKQKLLIMANNNDSLLVLRTSQ